MARVVGWGHVADQCSVEEGQQAVGEEIGIQVGAFGGEQGAEVPVPEAETGVGELVVGACLFMGGEQDGVGLGDRAKAVEEGVQPLPGGCAGTQRRGSVGDGIAQLARAFFEERLEQPGAAAEAAEDRALPDAGQGRDPVQRDGRPVTLGQEAFGGAQDRVAVAGRVGALRALAGVAACGAFATGGVCGAFATVAACGSVPAARRSSAMASTPH